MTTVERAKDSFRVVADDMSVVSPLEVSGSGSDGVVVLEMREIKSVRISPVPMKIAPPPTSKSNVTTPITTPITPISTPTSPTEGRTRSTSVSSVSKQNLPAVLYSGLSIGEIPRVSPQNKNNRYENPS